GTTGAVSHLDRGVAVSFQRLDLGHAVVRHVQHSDRDGLAFLGKNAGHADLATHQTQPMRGGRGRRIRHCFLHSRLRLVGANRAGNSSGPTNSGNHWPTTTRLPATASAAKTASLA